MARDCAQDDTGGPSSFAARTDDLIIMEGYGLGLFQIENVLTVYPAVDITAGVGVAGRMWGKPITLGDAEDESPEAQSE